MSLSRLSGRMWMALGPLAEIGLYVVILLGILLAAGIWHLVT